MLHPRNQSTNRYHLFQQLFPDFTQDNTLLDFGGNRGNLLYFSEGDIKINNYTSIDVSNQSILQGTSEFPDARFIYYDRWNSMYNHQGEKSLNFPSVDKKQDYIFSFSVFTHTDLEEFKKTLDWFDTFNYKHMAHSLLDIRCELTVKWFYNKRVNDYGKCVDIISVANDPSVYMFYLFDNDKLVVNEEVAPTVDSNHFTTFYDLDFLKENLGYSFDIQKPTPDLHPFVVSSK